MSQSLNAELFDLKDVNRDIIEDYDLIGALVLGNISADLIKVEKVCPGVR